MAYFPKLGRWRREDLMFVALCSVTGVSYVSGAHAQPQSVLARTAGGFRISETCVRAAIAKASFSGKDPGTIMFPIAIARLRDCAIARSRDRAGLSPNMRRMARVTHSLAAPTYCCCSVGTLGDRRDHWPPF